MSEPTTEAGKALAIRAKAEAWGNWEGLRQFTIPAIEQEARANADRELRERLGRAEHDVMQTEKGSCGSQVESYDDHLDWHASHFDAVVKALAASER